MAEAPLSTVPAAAAGLRVFALTQADMPRAQPLSAALKWPYRLEDWQSALALGSGVGIEIDGELCGTGLCWAWGDAYASVGMIIVSAERQGRGLGARIMQELLALAAGRTVVLRSTREGYRLYERLGIVPFGHVHQHQAAGASAAALAVSATLESSIRDFRPDDAAAIASLDRDASAMDRTRLLDFLRATGRIVVLERGGALAGYACVRRWGRGVVVGPVIAADVDGAKALIARLVALHAAEFVRIDVTDASGLSPWLESAGLPRVDAVVSMALGTAPPTGAGATLYALANQSLG